MTEDNGCSSCGSAGTCGGGEPEVPKRLVGKDGQVVRRDLEGSIDRREFARSLGRVKHKIVVLSCKGGVGKSTVAVNLAMALALQRKDVGLLDIDLHGPSVPKMLHLEEQQMRSAGHIMLPVKYQDFMKVISLGFMLNSRDDAVIWRGPSKLSVIQQYLRDVDWGDLDYLVIDAPPGTGDEPLSVCQLIPDLDGAVIVTSPQDLAILDVRKSITFCRKLGVNIIGIIENMSNFACPHCGKEIDMFGSGGGEKMAEELGVPFLGRIPMDAEVCQAGEKGKPFVYDNPGSETTFAFQRILPKILKLEESKDKTDTSGYSDKKE